jgi:hypothetical protein
MIRKGAKRFSLATNANACVEIMREHINAL